MLVLLLFVLAGCGEENMQNREASPGSRAVALAPVWEKLAAEKIYFGHQSVGFNIMQGLEDLAQASAGRLPMFVQTRDPGAFDKPIFAHSENGKNADAASKIEAFAETIDSGVGDRADVVFFKLCFVDITQQTDVPRVFELYRSSMSKIRMKYPRLAIVHVTVPLMTVEGGVKAWVKKWIGRAPDGYQDNVRRNEYNDQLRLAYSGKEPLYDLAGVESTTAAGKTVRFSHAGRQYQALDPLSTDDGGHLNKEGRRRAAQRLLEVLGNL